MFNESITFKGKNIPQAILGNAPFIAEPYFGHRTRLYDLDLHRQSEKVAELIETAYNCGVRSINLVNDESLLKAYDIACDSGCKMDIVATIGKRFDIDYMIPDFVKARDVNWKEDIDLFSSYDSQIMLVDEFIVDGYDWDLTSIILSSINETNALAGLITNFPSKTTDAILKNLDLNLFDFYMVPINNLGYMMDTASFMGKQKEELIDKFKKLDKKIVASKILACGILRPQEAFNFINSLDFIDFATIGVASQNEIEQDFKTLFEI